MIATLKYGISQGITATISPDTLTRLKGSTLQEALKDLLGRANPGLEDGTIPAIREALEDQRSVIEVRGPEGYRPLDLRTPFMAILEGRADLEILISKAHAGG